MDSQRGAQQQPIRLLVGFNHPSSNSGYPKRFTRDHACPTTVVLHGTNIWMRESLALGIRGSAGKWKIMRFFNSLIF